MDGIYLLVSVVIVCVTVLVIKSINRSCKHTLGFDF